MQSLQYVQKEHVYDKSRKDDDNCEDKVVSQVSVSNIVVLGHLRLVSK